MRVVVVKKNCRSEQVSDYAFDLERYMCNDCYLYSTCLHANMHAYMHHACACVSGPVSGPVPVCIMRTNMHLHA